MAHSIARPAWRLLLVPIVLVGFGFRTWGLGWGLVNANVERRPHPDEWATYWLSQWFAKTGTLNPCPSSSHGQCFFDWGSLYPYASYGLHYLVSSALTVLPAHLFGAGADPAFVTAVLSGRIVSVLVSTVTIVLAYRFALRLYGLAAGLLAALLVALSGLLIQLAHFATPDSLTIFLCLGALFALREAYRSSAVRDFGLAGVLIGLAVGTEYHMALLLLPALVAWAMSGGARSRAITLMAGVVAAYLISNPYVLVEIQPFLASLEHTLRIRTVESGIQYQGRFSRYGPDMLYLVRYPLGYGVGIGLTVWMVLTVVRMLIRRSRDDLLLLSWILPYALLVSLSPAKFMRYGGPLLPPLCIVAAGFLVELARRQRFSIRSAAVAAGVVAVGFTVLYDAAYAGLFTTIDARAAATVWLTHHVHTGKKVAFEGLPDGLINLPYFVTAAGYQPCFSEFRDVGLRGPISYFVTDDYSLEEHPRTSQAQVQSFRRALSQSAGYRAVVVLHYVPTILGVRFPIDGSPHDWRYPSHEITIYQRVNRSAHPSNLCFPNLRTAQAALYRPPASSAVAASH